MNDEQLGRRKRMIRIRAVEHRAAQARLAKAQGDLSDLARLASRLEMLRSDLAVGAGTVQGMALKSLGEMAMRLEAAREQLKSPINDALDHRDEMTTIQRGAHAREESASRLYDRSRASADRARERAADANAPRLRRMQACYHNEMEQN
jgi:hypothetical protein